MKQDIYNHEQRYKNWKEMVSNGGENLLTKNNSKVLLEYIFDMEVGNNVSSKSKKGARTYHRLNVLKQKVSKVMRLLQERGVKDITKVTEKQIQSLFDDMRKGKLLTPQGKPYKATADYVKGFKAFWHWHMKASIKKNIVVGDITEYLDASREVKPKWVYLDEKQMEKFLKNCRARYLPLVEFMYDAGSRVTEAMSLTAGNITKENGFIFANIPDEVSKTFGRKIKLMLCGKNLLQYIKERNLKESDLLFEVSPPFINRYLKQLAVELFGDGKSKAGGMYSELSLYDIRHNSVCYWLPRYKSESAIKYRFGWKKSDMIHYYSELLGMKDPIREEDLYVDITKSELEREQVKLRKELKQMKATMKEIINEINGN